MFAKIRFHDTVSRGRLLNRFGKDLETIDSNQADHFGKTVIYALNTTVTVFTVTIVGGPYFLIAIFTLGALYYRAARIYGQTSRDMRRLGVFIVYYRKNMPAHELTFILRLCHPITIVFDVWRNNCWSGGACFSLLSSNMLTRF